MSKQQIYLTQIIGEQYKLWLPGDTILLDSPTGTGKTSICLKLAEDAMHTDDKILYITSRIAIYLYNIPEVRTRYLVQKHTSVERIHKLQIHIHRRMSLLHR